MAFKFLGGLVITGLLFGLLFLGSETVKLVVTTGTFILLTLLLLLFGLSLLKGKTPIITRYALLINAEDTVKERNYTRIVTWFWFGFLISLWLLKINVLLLHVALVSVPYLEVYFYLGSLVLFIGEFYVRQLFLPKHRGSSLSRFLLELAQIPLKKIWLFDKPL